ncbi:MAG: nickel-dependent hydrogenase large subunit [Desulfobacterales bacterium]|jgi:hydrogenase large subunit
MTRKKVHLYPLNRVEGDLDLSVEIEDGVVREAYSAGVMYRGFENLLVGRAPLDGLVLTPRICGICSTSHLNAAAKALDMFFDVIVPDNAKRIRNVTLIAEKIQNDFRHAFLLFMADFTNKAYKGLPLYAEAVRRYEPLTGETAVQTIRETKKILEIIAILGGQWPHSSFMVPGGVVCVPSANEITQCLFLLRNFRKWYENRVLGCSIERWEEVKTDTDIDIWLDEAESHANSDLGFFIQFARLVNLDKIGNGHGNFISFGALDLPENTAVKSFMDDEVFFPAGFLQNSIVDKFNQEKITEDISHSWFDDDIPSRHPFEGTTQPYATGSESGKYSWAKAPRYGGVPAETGPLAEMLMASIPLVTDLVQKGGPNVYVREFARLIRSAFLIPVMEKWLEELASSGQEFYCDHGTCEHGDGYGLVEAPRGSLGHWLKIDEAKIQKYQIITPTAWNASPRDANGIRGPWEEAIVGTEIKDMKNPVELDHIIRSFDPCLVCTVHAIELKQRLWSITI